MGKREDNKARKRTDLESAAQALFLAQGYVATSIEQIVAEAGVARGTFYLYFDDKESLFHALVSAALDPVVDALLDARLMLEAADSAAETQAAYDLLAAALATAVTAHPEATLLFYREQRSPGPIGDWLRSRQMQLDQFVVELVRSLADRWLIRATVPQVTALAIVGAIDRLVYAWLSGVDLGDPVAVGPAIIGLFGEGLVRGDASALAH